MKVLSTEGLTKLIQLIKSTFIPASDTVSASTVTLADVATTGDYDDLINKPTIPAAQVNSDWDAVSGVAQILNKPTLATVATSGSYNDLTDKPTIPTVNDATLTIQKNGTTVDTFTANSATNKTVNITVPTQASDIGALSSSTKYGASLSYSSSTLQLLDQDGNALGSSVTITNSLSGLTDVTLSTPTSGQALLYDGSKWVNGSAGVSATYDAVNERITFA